MFYVIPITRIIINTRNTNAHGGSIYILRTFVLLQSKTETTFLLMMFLEMLKNSSKDIALVSSVSSNLANKSSTSGLKPLTIFFSPMSFIWWILKVFEGNLQTHEAHFGKVLAVNNSSVLYFLDSWDISWFLVGNNVIPVSKNLIFRCLNSWVHVELLGKQNY